MSLINKKTISAVVIFLLASGFYFLYLKTRPKIIIKPREEVTLTIIPGWNLRQVADYLVIKGLATSTEAVYRVTRFPAINYRLIVSAGPDIFVSKDYDFKIPYFASFEGYLAPETYRVYKDASLESILQKMVDQRHSELPEDVKDHVKNSKYTWLDILTMASIIEKEAKHDEDRAKVSDILWRRLEDGWPLQVDSSVHYAVDKTGDVFTTGKERDGDSPWNTYKFKGLPPGPISNPGLKSIWAALNPEKNNYVYFLSDKAGNLHYARNLDEHNQNRIKYLR